MQSERRNEQAQELRLMVQSLENFCLRAVCRSSRMMPQKTLIFKLSFVACVTSSATRKDRYVFKHGLDGTIEICAS